jgi:cyanophycin synthetase
VAVTGTNGKTTTTRLIAHMASQAGQKPGFCVSDGIYINNHLIYEGDCTGAVSAQQVLFDPTIDFAVLECARGGILRSGLGFEKCDVSVITNIGEDHIGMHDIHTLDDMARVKGVLARNTRETGYTVLNADDNKVYGLYDALACKKALFSLDPDNERVKSHLKTGGLAAVIEDNAVVVYHGTRTMIEKLSEIPLTFGGKAGFMVQNVLAAVLAGVASGFETGVIREALRSFSPSPLHTPGRLNLFDFGAFRVIVDYVHNAEGFKEVKKFVDAFSASARTAIVSVAGDRRDDDIRAVGMVCATAFDRVITRDDRNLRGRLPGATAALIREGVHHIDASMECTHITNEEEAIETAIGRAQKDELIFICADNVKQTLHLVESLQQERTATHA